MEITPKLDPSPEAEKLEQPETTELEKPAPTVGREPKPLLANPFLLYGLIFVIGLLVPLVFA